MFHHLPASTPVRLGRRGGTFFAASLLHAGLVALAVGLTTAVTAPAPASPPVDTIAFYPPLSRDVVGASADLPSVAWCPDCRIDRIHVELDHLDSPFAGDVPIDWRSGAMPGPTGVGAGDALRLPNVGGPITAALADEPPIRLAGPAPVYPALLRGAGLSGTVTLEVIIGSDGRPDSASLRVVAATHAGFVEAARAAVLGGRYRAGRLGGQPVPVLIRQAVAFQLR